MRSYLRYLAIFVFSMFILAGCSDDDDNPTGGNGGNNGNAPAVPVIQFKGPNTQSQDPQVQQIKAYVEVMNSFSLYSNAFKDLPATQSGNNWVRTFTSEGLTATLTTSSTTGGYSWRLILNGTVDSVSYNNFLAAEGNSSTDGKSGSWKIYDEESNSLSGEYSWGYNTGNVLTGELKTYDNGTETGRMTLLNNPDNSGELSIFDGQALMYKATWVVNGTGQWNQYDGQGNVVSSGTW